MDKYSSMCAMAAQILDNRPLLAGRSNRTTPLTPIAHRRLRAFRILLAFAVPEFG